MVLRTDQAALSATKAADESWFTSIDEEADGFASALREAVVNMRGPTPASILDHVYAEPHPLVDEERAEMIALLGAEDAGSLK